MKIKYRNMTSLSFEERKNDVPRTIFLVFCPDLYDDEIYFKDNSLFCFNIAWILVTFDMILNGSLKKTIFQDMRKII